MEPKYPIGTLVLSNIPYSYGNFRRERDIGIIIYVYERILPFSNTSENMYVVEWCSREHKSPASYTAEDVECFVSNLSRYMSDNFF